MSNNLKFHARRWLNDPVPDDLLADLAEIVKDEDYSAEARAHQVVWQALKWMMNNETHADEDGG